MAHRRKLIEVALPLQAINEASARERTSRRGHPHSLHPWPARRPLATCQAVVFASYVDDPDSPGAPPDFVQACASLPRGRNALQLDTPRQRLLDFVEVLVRWESMTDDQVLGAARELIRLSTGGNPPPLFDPFAGGGSIPLEAQRLGIPVHASDVDPLSTTLCRALVEIPSRFRARPPINPLDRTGPIRGAAGLAADTVYYGRWMLDRARERIGEHFPDYTPPAWGLAQIVMAWLWAYSVDCPNLSCGVRSPLVDSLWLARRKGRLVWLAPQVDAHTGKVTFDIARGKGGPGRLPRAGRGAAYACLACGAPIRTPYLEAEASAHRVGMQLLAVVTEAPQGAEYFAQLPSHEDAAMAFDPLMGRDMGAYRMNPDMMPRVAQAISPRALYARRQLLALTTLSDLIPEVREKVYADAIAAGLPGMPVPLRSGGGGAAAYGDAVSVYLGLALCQQALQLSTLCSWDPRGEGLRRLSAEPPDRVPWTYAEANPFSTSPVGFEHQLENVARAVEVLDGASQGLAARRDATRVGYVQRCAFATDPPYYGESSDPELSDQAYAWLSRSLRHAFPEELAAHHTPLHERLVVTPPPQSAPTDDGVHTPRDPFAEGLERAFSLMRGGADPDCLLTTFCAYADASAGQAGEGWETMVAALIGAGFTIEAAWPIRTSQLGAGQAHPLLPAPEVVLVCRPRPLGAPAASHREFASALRHELPGALREIQASRLAPIDVAQSSLGVGLAIFSRYSEVRGIDGRPLTVREALRDIGRALETFLIEENAVLDRISRFAISWFSRFGYAVHFVDEAAALARMHGTKLAALTDAGVLQTQGSRAWLARGEELDPRGYLGRDRPPLVWMVTHHLIRQLQKGGPEDAAALMVGMPPALAREARQLAYKLYSICDRNEWEAEARDYEALINAWGDIQPKEADRPTGPYYQRRLFD